MTRTYNCLRCELLRNRDDRYGALPMRLACKPHYRGPVATTAEEKPVSLEPLYAPLRWDFDRYAEMLRIPPELIRR